MSPEIFFKILPSKLKNKTSLPYVKSGFMYFSFVEYIDPVRLRNFRTQDSVICIFDIIIYTVRVVQSHLTVFDVTTYIVHRYAKKLSQTFPITREMVYIVRDNLSHLQQLK